MVRAIVLISAFLASTAVAQDITYIKDAPTPAPFGYFGAAVAFASASNYFVGGNEETSPGTAPTTPGFFTSYLNNTVGDRIVGYGTRGGSTTTSPQGLGASIAATATTVLVGARNDDTAFTASVANGNYFTTGPPATIAASTGGGVNVYTINAATGGLTFNGVLKAAATAAAGDCGYSVAIEGNTAVMGCPGYGTYGAAYIFTQSGTTWTGVNVPLVGTTTTDAGTAVGISGSVVAVGDSGTKQVLLFAVTGGAITATIAAPTLPTAVHFGHRLALKGTLLVVGDPSNAGCSLTVSTGCTAAGVVHFYRTVPALPVTGAQPFFSTQAPIPRASQYFGSSIAITTIDGVEYVYVGAPGDATCGAGAAVDLVNNYICQPSSGTVFAYAASGATFVFTGTAGKSLGPIPSGEFGVGTAAFGENVLVGARGEGNSNPGFNPPGVGSGNTTTSGAAYLYRASDEPNVTTCAVVCTSTFGGQCQSRTNSTAQATLIVGNATVVNGSFVSCASGSYPTKATGFVVHDHDHEGHDHEGHDHDHRRQSTGVIGATCLNEEAIALTCVGAPSTNPATFQAQVRAFATPALLAAWLEANDLIYIVTTSCLVDCVGTTVNTTVPRVTVGQDLTTAKYVTSYCWSCGVLARQVTLFGNVAVVCLPGTTEQECARQAVCDGILQAGADCNGTPCPSCSSSKKGLLGLLGLLGLIPLLLCCLLCCLLWSCCIRRKKTGGDVHFATFDPYANEGAAACGTSSLYAPTATAFGAPSICAPGAPIGTFVHHP